MKVYIEYWWQENYFIDIESKKTTTRNTEKHPHAADWYDSIAYFYIYFSLIREKTSNETAQSEQPDGSINTHMKSRFDNSSFFQY